VTGLVGAEWLKLRSVRSFWGYLAAVIVFAGIGTAGTVGSARASDRAAESFIPDLAGLATLSALIALVLGIVVVTGEFRHGTITPTFLAAPSRERVLASKALAGTLVFLLFGVLSLLVIAAVALPWLTITGDEIHFFDGEIGTRAAQTLLSAVLWGLLGVAIGSVVHSQVAALVGTLVWIFLVENLIVGLLGLLDSDGVTAYLPFRALDAADGTGGDNLISYWPAVAVSLGWIGLIGAAGVIRTRRRDIS
jgi:ABC-2 type transport system permease protein